jgi:1-deoxy-D-xylulose-5-phosphate reductoisomerase
MKRITILGSTGSIGQSALDVISRNSKDFRVVGLAAGKNLDLLERQIKTFHPEVAAVADEKAGAVLNKRVGDTEILTGIEGINHVASHENCDIVMSAIVGSAGLIPTLAAIRSGKSVALANKEALVMAGEIVMKEARKKKTKIIPVDSEHSAVFQCIEGRKRTDIERIILTASGGPFIEKSRREFENISADDALKHPSWNMGKKITIDSATLMNKGLEVIEACWLFDFPPDKIDIVIHPQSIVHSMVEFKDGSCLAQMSTPDMRGPISYALNYPHRLKSVIPRLELDKIQTLTFREPDSSKFPCLSYAYDAIRIGGTMPCVLNASNEVAVHAFLHNNIGFKDIPFIIKKTVDSHTVRKHPTFEEVLEADTWGKTTAEKFVKEIQK